MTLFLKFRSLLDATLNGVATTGRHFNPQLFTQAVQIYCSDNASHFGNNEEDPRAMVFWQQVIGYIQRCMPANYVQAFCNGIDNTKEKYKKIRHKAVY